MRKIWKFFDKIRKDLRFLLSTKVEVNQEASVLYLLDRLTYYRVLSDGCQASFEDLLPVYHDRGKKLLGVLSIAQSALHAGEQKEVVDQAGLYKNALIAIHKELS